MTAKIKAPITLPIKSTEPKRPTVESFVVLKSVFILSTCWGKIPPSHDEKQDIATRHIYIAFLALSFILIIS